MFYDVVGEAMAAPVAIDHSRSHTSRGLSAATCIKHTRYVANS